MGLDLILIILQNFAGNNELFHTHIIFFQTSQQKTLSEFQSTRTRYVINLKINSRNIFTSHPESVAVTNITTIVRCSQSRILKIEMGLFHVINRTPYYKQGFPTVPFMKPMPKKVFSQIFQVLPLVGIFFFCIFKLHICTELIPGNVAIR